MVKRWTHRWREGAPDFVYDAFLCNGSYTIIFKPFDSEWYPGGVCVPGLEMNSQPTSPCYGVSLWFELKWYELSAYRDRSRHTRIKWADIPQELQQHAINRYIEPSPA